MKLVAVRGFLLFWGFIVVFAQGLFAQAGTAGAFLRLGIGARAKGMGDAYTALAKGIETAYYNPAGLHFLENKEFVVSYRLLSLDRQYSFVGFGMPIRPKIADSEAKTLNGGFALSWIRAGVGDIDARDTDGRHFDDLSNSENAFMFSFALNPVEKFSVGLSVKVLWNRFPDIGREGEAVSATGVGFDLGVLYRPIEWVSVGALVKDLNARYRWNSTKVFGEEDGSETINDFPKSLRTAVAFRVPQAPNITFAFDLEQFFREKLFQNKIEDRFHFGAQGLFQEVFVVRAGFNDGSLTAGGGYEFDLFGKMSQLNYAFASAGDRAEGEHVFTWVFQF